MLEALGYDVTRHYGGVEKDPASRTARTRGGACAIPPVR
ncbi:hypothetical protein [Streptomyces sp. NPDC091259]